MEEEQERRKKRGLGTRELPRLALVDVDVGDHGEAEAAAADLALEVVEHQLLIRRMEAEPRRPPLGVPQRRPHSTLVVDAVVAAAPPRRPSELRRCSHLWSTAELKVEEMRNRDG